LNISAYRWVPNWLVSCWLNTEFSLLWMDDADIDGSKISTFGPRSGLPLDGGVEVGVAVGLTDGVGDEPPTGTRANDCALVPLQAYCCNCTLSEVDPAGTSRHLPVFRLSMWYEPSASWTGCHCWLFPPE
jgi:hypothetical protein